jgi:hypothetical protein
VATDFIVEADDMQESDPRGSDDNSKLMETMKTFATKHFTECGSLMTMWTIVGENEIVPMMTPFQSDEERQMMLIAVKTVAQSRNAIRIGMMTEAWVARAPAGMSKEDALELRPSKMSGKAEVVLLLVEDQNGQRMAGMYDIIRDKDGKGTLGKFRLSTKGMFGSFSELFPKRTVN